MPRPKKDQIVGGKDADLTNSPPETSKALVPSSAYLVQDKIHSDIFEMYEAGVAPQDISRKYPLYSPQNILELCASEYSLNHLDGDQIDAVLFKGMLRDLTRLDRYIKDNMGDAKQALEGMKTLIDARDRTVKYRQLLEPKLGGPNTADVADTEPLTWTIEQKITTIIKRKSPEEASKLIAKIEQASETELAEILEAEFKVVEEQQRLEDSPAPDPKEVVE